MTQLTVKFPESWEKAIAKYMKQRDIGNRHRAVVELIAMALKQYGIEVKMPPERGKYRRKPRSER